MRTMFRMLLAASFVAAAIPAWSQATPVFGRAAQPGCTGLFVGDTENAELIVVKVPSGGDCTDMEFDLRQKTGGQNVGGATVGDPSAAPWTAPPNWRLPQTGTDVHFAYFIMPPATGSRANRMMVDSGTIANQSFGPANTQTVGNSLPASFPGQQGIDLVLAGTGYPVKLRGRTPAADPVNFPRGAQGGIEVAFSPLAEVNNASVVSTCTVAGRDANPSGTNAIDGAILGYNVYRLAGTAGSPPTAQQFYDASIDNDPATGWQYFLPLTDSYNLALADNLSLGSPTPPAASDSNPNDLGGLQNPDGVMFNGDEVMIYQDTMAPDNRGTARVSGTPPVAGQGYWYAFQPNMCGSITQFTSPMAFAGSFNGVHAIGVSALAGTPDALDLDLNGSVDFFSPQADVGQPGLGFTYNSLPVLSEPVFGQVDPLPALGQVTLSGNVDGSNVNITFQSGLETGDVEGFNVYRGAARVRVNSELILAQGGESNVYALVDDAVQARRLARGGVIEYSVEIVYADGHTSMVGPFSVAVGQGAAAPSRRGR